MANMNSKWALKHAVALLSFTRLQIVYAIRVNADGFYKRLLNLLFFIKNTRNKLSFVIENKNGFCTRKCLDLSKLETMFNARTFTLRLLKNSLLSRIWQII